MDIESETLFIQDFVDKGNFHAAINTAISAMNACRKENDRKGIDHFIQVMKGIIDVMNEEFGS